MELIQQAIDIFLHLDAHLNELAGSMGGWLYVLLFLIVFDMAVKPQWGNASLWIAVLAFAALAVLLVRNGMNARLGAVAASAAE